MKRVAMLIVVLLLPIVLLFTTLERVTFDVDYFDRKYEEYNIAKETGISKSDLTDITKKLLGYLNSMSTLAKGNVVSLTANKYTLCFSSRVSNLI